MKRRTEIEYIRGMIKKIRLIYPFLYTFDKLVDFDKIFLGSAFYEKLGY